MRTRTGARLLGEIVVIVAGILLALAADAWWEGRRDAAREQEYLGALLADVEATAAEALRTDSLQAIERRRIAGILADVRAGTPVTDSLIRASQPVVFLLRARLDTYRDLTTTGGTTLIRDPEVRRALAEVSAQLEFNLDGQVWALDLISVMRAAVLSEEGPVSGGRMANVLSAFLDALERLRAAKADVVEAARAATPVIESAIR